MSQLCDLAIHVNGQQTFFLNEKILSAYSGKLKKIFFRSCQIKDSGIEIKDFPGGADGFELVSRFCYNHGRIKITVSNVALLHCCAVFLVMTEDVSSCNLLKQTQTFLDGMFYWSWNDILVSLKSCESVFLYASSSGLVEKLICALLAKIAHNSEKSALTASSSNSSSSSPEIASGFRLSSSAKTTPDLTRPAGSSKRQWWFDDLTILPPTIIEKVIENFGAYGAGLILTKFLLHYLKNAVLQSKGRTKSTALYSRSDYGALADAAVHGVILVGRSAFSCRGLFSVLRIVSGFGLSKDCRTKLERLIGGVLDQATLDDLLVSGHDHKGVYDVNLVSRLIKIFVISELGSSQKLKKVGRLIDKYLCEISPDQNLKTSKFLGVAETLPDSARDCFDGVYRAIDFYFESHPTLPFEERSRLCRCLNYAKLSLEACKDLAKNPRIPPNIAVQALKLQHSKINPKYDPSTSVQDESPSTGNAASQMVLYNSSTYSDKCLAQENEDMKINMQRMQRRVVELEKACREVKGSVSSLVRHNVSVMSSAPCYNGLDSVESCLFSCFTKN